MDAIHPKPGEADFDLAKMLYINPATCIDCYAVCPTQAIYLEDEVPEAELRFVALNAKYFTDGLDAADPD